MAVLRGAAIAASDPFGLGALDSLAAPALGPGLGNLASVASATAPAHAGAAVAAGMGQATPVGALSVPARWTAATPVASPPAAASGSLVASWAPAAPNGEPGGMPGMPGMAPPGSGAGRGYGFAAPRYGFKPTVMARPVIAG
jgi:PPE-repeat protein